MSALERFGRLAAAVLVDKLDHPHATSSKVIIDYLRDEERAAVMTGLSGGKHRVLSLATHDDAHEVRAVCGDCVDIIAVEVRPVGEVDPTRGQVTEGYASMLRDHFAQGAPSRPRVLVTLTPEGNETQRSASDSAEDRALITPASLAAALRREVGIEADDPRARPIETFLAAERRSKRSWTESLDRLSRYLEAVARGPVEEAGTALGELGGFFPDANEDWASASRLAENARIHEKIAETFDDPLEDTRAGLAGDFDDDTVSALIEAGRGGLTEVDFGAIKSRPDEGKKGRNSFDTSGLVVEGAHHHHLTTGQDHAPILSVAARAAFTVSIPLARGLSSREYVHLVGWDEGKGGPRGIQGRVESQDEGRVAVHVTTDREFAVYRVIISGGPRAFKRSQDVIWLVVYGKASCVAIEVGCELSLERQAWVQHEYRATFDVWASDQPQSVEHIPRPGPDEAGVEDAEDLEGDALLAQLALPASGLVARVFWPGEELDEIESDVVHPYLEAGLYARMRPEVRSKVVEALNSQDRYLAALTNLARHDDEWVLRLAETVRFQVVRNHDAQIERAVGRILFDGATRKLLLRPDHEEREWERVRFASEALGGFRDARTKLFESLRVEATRHPWTDRNREGVPISLMHVDLVPFAPQIDAYLESWLAAYDAITPAMVGFSSGHRELIETDVVEELDDEDQLRSLTVLPTHPWLLSAMLRFQRLVARDLAQMSTSQQKKFGLDLSSSEVDELAHPAPVDDWFAGDGTRLHRTDGPPFHWRFLPERAHRRRGGLSYLERVVRNKIRRYLEMHRHLRDARRRLRIGFVNPGDAHHLLAGIQTFLGEERNREDSIPSIEVLLFTTHDGEVDGGALDEFFASSLVSSSEKPTVDLFLQKVSYLKRRDARCPATQEDFVHICFFRGLVDDAALEPKDRAMDAGWDGAFDEGLLSVPLRETRPEGDGLRTERALWIGDLGTPLRGALVRLSALLRGSRGGSVDPTLGLAWGAALPTLVDIESMYEHSDWVVHLDRAIGLELFDRFRKQSENHRRQLTVIEYSDQEDPTTPGYDTITVTKNAGPYVDQLSKVLEYADLKVDVQQADAKAYGEELIADINELSGSWAIDFILGNVTNAAWNNRLKGNVGAALVYRWLCRVEREFVRDRYGDDLVPIYLSLEELIRATPAAGLPLKHGMFRRFSNDNEPTKDISEKVVRSICDDLLVLYLSPSFPNEPTRIFGRVIEVKFGTQPTGSLGKGVEQVRGTHDLLSKHLSGDADRRDSAFRHKQLSMLLKARIEQARLNQTVTADEMARLDLRALSTNLAAGRYEVEYTLGTEGKHVLGDVFLLSTTGGEEREPQDVELSVQNGVRVVKMWPRTLEWLAFHAEQQDTLHGLPPNTVPDLGSYGAGPSPATDRPPPPDTEPPPPDTEPPPSDTQPTPDEQVSRTDEAPAEPTQDPTPPEASPEARSASDDEKVERVSLADAQDIPVKIAPYPKSEVKDVVDRLSRALEGHKVKLEVPPSIEEAELGPSLVRVHVQLLPGESISSVRRISEDLARDIGTKTPDVHVCNVPERHSIGVDLPIEGLDYAITFDELREHASFAAAAHDLQLGFCAGIDVTGRAVWTDLATMPHALVAGTTGSGKTVFLRQLLLTLLLHHEPATLSIRLSSSKPMDFNVFTRVPHAGGIPLADDATAAGKLVDELVDEMDRRIRLISDEVCDNLVEFNDTVSADRRLPYVVAILDEYSETVLSIHDKQLRAQFEPGVARLAQKSRAAGIHMVLCMQRPDAAVLQGPIKSNILHRFALKLPQQHDSRVILDENGAEALLGRGDMLYKDGSGRVSRLQVPFLESIVLKRVLKQLA